MFCDASKRAYATVIYLCVEYQDNVKVNLVFSKLRLVSVVKRKGKRPKKEITLPCLELMAVTIGVCAANFVTKELKIPSLKRTIWTDSTCVLCWLRTNKPLSLFVENHVKEIQRQSDLFYYMPSGENPADLPTMGLTVPEIEHSRLWWSGPDWLMSSRDSWPKWQPPQPVLQEVETETARVLYECSNVASHGLQDVNLSVCGINEKKYSSLRKLLRVTCYCLKFVKNNYGIYRQNQGECLLEKDMLCWLKYLVHYLMDSLYVLLISSWLCCCGFIVFNRINFVMCCLLLKRTSLTV